jgi:DNA-binding PadR family transcriptional regulator
MVREALLALLSKEPSHGYDLHQRLSAALGEAQAELNPGQVYVVLSRLERSGLVAVREVPREARPDRRGPERKVYEVTAAGREVVGQWLAELSWRKPAPVEFHLKLVAAAATGLTDPVALIDAQRRELLRRLAELRRAIEGQPSGGHGPVLLEGAALRLEADIRWLELCERHWIGGRTP